MSSREGASPGTRRTGRRRLAPRFGVLIAVLLAAAWFLSSERDQHRAPLEWGDRVPTKGQAFPVPRHWIEDQEARIAHELELPPSVPRPVPFRFFAAQLKSMVPGQAPVSLQYFDHLCATEAGQWIFRTVPGVEGIYFARPQGVPPREMLLEPYGPEMPWIQRILVLRGDTPKTQASWLVSPPFHNYTFVEQPRRLDAAWQAHIKEPYIRLSGYRLERSRDQRGSLTTHYREAAAMTVQGIPQPEARYGYTWRGISRPRDREHGIAGGEILIYDRATLEVLGLRRQFLIATPNRRGPGKAMWEIAAKCPQLPTADHTGLEFGRFPEAVVPPRGQHRLSSAVGTPLCALARRMSQRAFERAGSGGHPEAQVNWCMAACCAERTAARQSSAAGVRHA